MKKKTKQDFQELLKTEHCKNTKVSKSYINDFKGFTSDSLSVPALLEGFEIRESISFIEEHINRQVRLLKHSLI